MDRLVSRPGAVAGVFALLVVIALVVTLASLAPEDDADGTHNMVLLPFALPWILVVPAASTPVADSIVTASVGLANAALLYALLRRRKRKEASPV